MAETWPTVTVGSTGHDVRTIQLLVAAHGHPVAVDGIFGPATRTAVQAVQTGAGLDPDGVVGAATWPALLVTVSPGDSGEAVRAVQGQLRGQGWRLAVDGAFGPQTTRSVRDFQTARHLAVDGVVGPVTWNALVAGFEHLTSPEEASTHLYDAWGADDRATALRNATRAAADLLLRGQRGDLTSVGCQPSDVLGPDHVVCSYVYEGGAVSLHVVGDSVDGYFVESATFVAD